MYVDFRDTIQIKPDPWTQVSLSWQSFFDLTDPEENCFAF